MRLLTRGGSLCVAALAIVAANLCGACTWQSPRTVAQDYLTALQEHRYKQCYAMLTDDDRKACPLERFLATVPLAPEVTRRWFRPALKATSFEIGEPVGQGLRRITPIKVKTPDLPLFERIINATVGPDADPAPVARDALAHGDYPQLAYRDDIVLVKEHHRWRVEADFGAREFGFELKAPISTQQVADPYVAVSDLSLIHI